MKETMLTQLILNKTHPLLNFIYHPNYPPLSKFLTSEGFPPKKIPTTTQSTPSVSQPPAHPGPGAG